MKGLQFNEEEKQLLVESLLFTASCDICSDHTNKHRAEMVKLAEKINNYQSEVVKHSSLHFLYLSLIFIILMK